MRTISPTVQESRVREEKNVILSTRDLFQIWEIHLHSLWVDRVSIVFDLSPKEEFSFSEVNEEEIANTLLGSWYPY